MTRSRMRKPEAEGSGKGAIIAMIVLLIVLGPPMIMTVVGVGADLLVQYHILSPSVLVPLANAMEDVANFYHNLPFNGG